MVYIDSDTHVRPLSTRSSIPLKGLGSNGRSANGVDRCGGFLIVNHRSHNFGFAKNCKPHSKQFTLQDPDEFIDPEDSNFIGDKRKPPVFMHAAQV